MLRELEYKDAGWHLSFSLGGLVAAYTQLPTATWISAWWEWPVLALNRGEVSLWESEDRRPWLLATVVVLAIDLLLLASLLLSWFLPGGSSRLPVLTDRVVVAVLMGSFSLFAWTAHLAATSLRGQVVPGVFTAVDGLPGVFTNALPTMSYWAWLNAYPQLLAFLGLATVAGACSALILLRHCNHK